MKTVAFICVVIVSVLLLVMNHYEYDEGYTDGYDAGHDQGLVYTTGYWRDTAEHYGGICKWLLNNKPIYGTVELGDNAVLRDCLIVSGSEEASVVVDGEDAWLINNTFRAINMDWLNSLTPVDPNEVLKEK